MHTKPAGALYSLIEVIRVVSLHFAPVNVDKKRHIAGMH